MEYNTDRETLRIPEYGRNIQKMIDHAVALEDKEERNKMCNAIVKVMAQVSPLNKDIEEFQHKLWDHMFIISRYALDVESPYPKPSPDAFAAPPEPVTYPTKRIRYRHYGRSVEDMISKAMDWEEGEEKEALILSIANLMKRSYLNWNKDSVNDELILKQLEELSQGKLKLKEGLQLTSTQEIMKTSVRTKRPSTNQGKSHQGKSNQSRSNQGRNQNWKRRN